MEETLQYVLKVDKNGNPLEGGKNYKIHLPPNIPLNQFWSMIVYDKETDLIIQTDQNWPSVHSQSSNLIINQDGSVDAFFGPNVQANSGINCVKTIPGKNWYLILRLYGVTELSNVNNWKPDEIIELYTT
jgi:hypothetical protein